MQDWASSGVRKLEELGGASARRAVIDDAELVTVGANASMEDAHASRMARLVDEAFMVFEMLRHYSVCLEQHITIHSP